MVLLSHVVRSMGDSRVTDGYGTTPFSVDPRWAVPTDVPCMGRHERQGLLPTVGEVLFRVGVLPYDTPESRSRGGVGFRETGGWNGVGWDTGSTVVG